MVEQEVVKHDDEREECVKATSEKTQGRRTFHMARGINTVKFKVLSHQNKAAAKCCDG